MQLARTFDAGFINCVANHPKVRPHLGGDGVSEVKFDDTVALPTHYALTFEPAGAIVLLAMSPGVYSGHCLFLPEHRGEAPAEAVRQAAQFMFIETDCVHIETQVPSGNVAAKALAQHTGFREVFRRLDVWPRPGGGQDVTAYALTLAEWAMKSDACRKAGEAFHKALEDAVAALGHLLPPHSDDGGIHDHAAGATYLMVQAGNVRKAVEYYNGWARSAWVPTIQLLSENPVVVDINDAVLMWRNGEMQALSAHVESRAGGVPCLS